jgi:hypothetical protein
LKMCESYNSNPKQVKPKRKILLQNLLSVTIILT